MNIVTTSIPIVDANGKTHNLRVQPVGDVPGDYVMVFHHETSSQSRRVRVRTGVLFNPREKAYNFLYKFALRHLPTSAKTGQLLTFRLSKSDSSDEYVIVGEIGNL